jgi:hypothetical protein
MYTRPIWNGLTKPGSNTWITDQYSRTQQAVYVDLHAVHKQNNYSEPQTVQQIAYSMVILTHYAILGGLTQEIAHALSTTCGVAYDGIASGVSIASEERLGYFGMVKNAILWLFGQYTPPDTPLLTIRDSPGKMKSTPLKTHTPPTDMATVPTTPVPTAPAPAPVPGTGTGTPAPGTGTPPTPVPTVPGTTGTPPTPVPGTGTPPTPSTLDDFNKSYPDVSNPKWPSDMATKIPSMSEADVKNLACVLTIEMNKLHKVAVLQAQENKASEKKVKNLKDQFVVVTKAKTKLESELKDTKAKLATEEAASKKLSDELKDAGDKLTKKSNKLNVARNDLSTEQLDHAATKDLLADEQADHKKTGTERDHLAAKLTGVTHEFKVAVSYINQTSDLSDPTLQSQFNDLKKFGLKFNYDHHDPKSKGKLKGGSSGIPKLSSSLYTPPSSSLSTPPPSSLYTPPSSSLSTPPPSSNPSFNPIPTRVYTPAAVPYWYDADRSIGYNPAKPGMDRTTPALPNMPRKVYKLPSSSAHLSYIYHEYMKYLDPTERQEINDEEEAAYSLLRQHKFISA